MKIHGKLNFQDPQLKEKCRTFHETPQKAITICLDMLSKRRSIRACPIFFRLTTQNPKIPKKAKTLIFFPCALLDLDFLLMPAIYFLKF